jgi:SDR family mycofactocin-dependent oxidoreductase
MAGGRLENRVALISGVARGQGRSHAVRLASEGAHIIGFDLPGPSPHVGYPLATKEDLAETVRLVEAVGGRIVAGTADVRDGQAVQAVVDRGIDALGPVNVVVANAGIISPGKPFWKISEEQWNDVIDVNLTGVWRTVKAAVPSMLSAGNGGSVILIASAAAVRGPMGIADYISAKSGLLGMMRTMARELARHDIRVNSILPGNVSTDLIHNDAMYRQFRPELENPTIEDVEPHFRRTMLLRRPWAEVQDISNAVAFLASDESRNITSIEFPVDLGGILK